MQWLAVYVLVMTIYGGGGVTKTSGLDQFWTDDYKVFEQIYGKTSDRELYGATLPPTISFTVEPRHSQASEKKERYLTNNDDSTEEIDPYEFGDKYNIPKMPAKKQKQATSSFNFISYNDFKPISQSTDPETYNYLKHLEETERANGAIPKGIGGFKPYINYVGPNPEETDAYKSIQEILDAHEANKAKTDEDDGNSKYLTYREKPKPKVQTNKPFRTKGEGFKLRCAAGRCRKRSNVSYRSRARPYYRRIKHRLY